jgi:hypothetical protein
VTAGGLPESPPVPVSTSVAVAPCFLPAAVRVALKPAALTGANRTATVHFFPGFRLVSRQVPPVMVNAAGPASRIRSFPLAVPPVLASVNVREAVLPTATRP